ncbi:unnamed protein product [marine sediment metagenome]|uniref:Phage replisome organiser N-terminal domain-containing protein n=1 Tax=marine sediment metagenome TaxID=412755 RepID=X1S520_9ZZZZ
MPLPWMKMWIEALDDTKLTRMSLAERGAWWGILKLAHKCEAEGKLVSGGVGLDMDEIADALHIKTPADRQSLESMVDKMKERGSLIWNKNHTLTIVHYEERQKIPPSARPEAVAERVRLHRERKRERKPPDPMLADRQSLMGIEYRKRRKELGRELTTEERFELQTEIDRRLEKKYGRKIKDALDSRES